MGNKYYKHQSVKNPQEASIFSDQYTWNIMDALRVAGTEGMSAESVHTELEKIMRTSVSRSKIYGLLRRLYQMGWVHRYYDQKDETQHSVIAFDWGGVAVQENYDRAIIDNEKNYIEKKIFPIFLELMKRTIDDLDRDKNNRNWLPATNDYCKFCRRSHEADEFFNSVLDIVTAEFVESKEYLGFLKYYNYAEDELESIERS